MSSNTNDQCINSSIFQQVLYATCLLNGFDNLSNSCADQARRSLSSLLSFASQPSQPHTLLYNPTQQVFERIISNEGYTLPMIFGFAEMLLNISSDPQFCTDYCMLVLKKRLVSKLPSHITLKREEIQNILINDLSLFNAVKCSLEVLLEECGKDGFAGDYFDIVYFTMNMVHIALSLCKSSEADVENDENDATTMIKTKSSCRWDPVVNTLVPSLLKRMKDEKSRVHYKRIPLVENLEEALKLIYANSFVTKQE